MSRRRSSPPSGPVTYFHLPPIEMENELLIGKEMPPLVELVSPRPDLDPAYRSLLSPRPAIKT
ncbi:MAG: hypothetical protein ACRC7O_12620, partial [Fimbriiglobus sp.]